MNNNKNNQEKLDQINCIATTQWNTAVIQKDHEEENITTRSK